MRKCESASSDFNLSVPGNCLGGDRPPARPLRLLIRSGEERTADDASNPEADVVLNSARVDYDTVS